MKQYYYKWLKLNAKVSYHLKNVEILTAEIDNTTDPDARKRLIGLRSHHRRLARKYVAKAEICWQTVGRE